ncbi:hypothetical protein RIF29_30046 [Crotalaria pallida]|uniref:Thioredoxin-like protein n=1 Tax=Crotalaria pallida TaxID=3830 RepID=A0AAN9EFM3_CROPI
MSYLLPHLHSGWAVDQAILAEEERLVVILFGHDWDETCMQYSTSLFLSLMQNISSFLVLKNLCNQFNVSCALGLHVPSLTVMEVTYRRN